ncbi:hypothetical protein D3C77_710620 [compost metagenome]
MAANYKILPLDSWTNDWVLGPLRLSCRHCLVSQAFQNAEDPFPAHVSGCEATSRQSQYPLLELAGILRYLADASKKQGKL